MHKLGSWPNPKALQNIDKVHDTQNYLLEELF